MRVQTIAAKYPTYLRQFYARRPDLSSQPYVDQHTALMVDSFGAPETRSVALSEFGHETSHIFVNAKLMQKQWALEHCVVYNEANWLLEIVEAQVKAFRPDVLLVGNYSAFTRSFLQRLRVGCPSIHLVLGWCGSPYRDPSVFYAYDVILSNVTELVRLFRKNGHCCYHLNHAFDPRILARIDTERPPSADFGFIGSINPSFHREREALIRKLMKRIELQIWSEVKQPSWRQRTSKTLRQTAYDIAHMIHRIGISRKILETIPLVQRVYQWEERPSLSQYVDTRILQRARSPLFGLAMFQQLCDLKVTLNTHIDISANSASNMRLFEATGVATCLLTDWKANLPDLFEPDVEVVTYRSADECAEKARYLLSHERERQDIAAAGQARTLKDHTVRQRAEQIEEIIRSHLRRSVARQ